MKVSPNFKMLKEHPMSYELHDGKDGRSFHVAKADLSPEMHETVKKIPMYSAGTPDSEITPAPNSIPSTYVAPDDSKMSESDASALAAINRYKQEAPSRNSAIGSTLEKVGNSFIGQNPMNVFSDKTAEANVIPQPAPVLSPNNNPDTSNSIEASPDFIQKNISEAEASLAAERATLLGGAGAEGNLGKQEKQAWDQFGTETSDRTDQYNSRIQELHEADDKLMYDFANKNIDPDRYWKNRTTGQQISSAIGLIFGGASAGSLGTQNYALQKINNAVQNDIDAQKNDQSQSMNLWKMNREATHNETQAYLDAQAQSLNAVRGKIAGLQAASASPIAAARLAPIIRQLTDQISDLHFRSSAIGSTSQGGTIKTDPSLFLSKIQDPAQREAATKEVVAAKQLANTRSQSLDAFRQLESINTIGNRLASPIQTSSQTQAIRDNAATNLAKDEAGRVSEYDFKAAQKAFGGAGLNEESTNVEYNNLANIINRKRIPGTAFQTATGIPLERFESTNSSIPPRGLSALSAARYVDKNSNNPDPRVRARVSFVKNKFGIR